MVTATATAMPVASLRRRFVGLVWGVRSVDEQWIDQRMHLRLGLE